MSTQEIADRNVERLVSVAYQPEPIDPAFVRETADKLRIAAARAAETHEVSPFEAAKLLRIRRRLGWAMTAAAAVAGCMLGWYARSPFVSNSDRRVASGPQSSIRSIADSPAGLGLTAKPRPESAKPQALAVGASLTTQHNERRRVALADGSILFVNENTTLTHAAPRQLRLDKGEVYLEVAPKDVAEHFVVATPERQFTATGTHFHVAATAAGSGVLVTQGKVKVSDVPGEIPAGQQVKPGQKQPTVAPRASHVLDWLKPLVAAADAPLVPAGKHDGGCLIALDPNGQELQLTLRKYHIDVHIEDGFARTTIDQTYFNNTWNRLEGTFYFPLAPDASLSRLAMYVVEGNDCKLMEGGMAERGQARNAYETIRYERRDPALLEWVDGSTFKMRVFPLEAWQEKRIILSYTQRLPSLYGVAKYRFPGGHNMQIVRDWSFAADIKNAKNWDVLTPSHPDMKRLDAGADGLALRTEARLIKPEQDVVLELREREAPPDGATFATYLQDGQRYFMARYRPKLDTKPKRQRRDWIVLFESSANRDPLLARTQIDVIRNLLKNAEYDDTFTLLAANTRVQVFQAKPQAATPANVQAAVEFLEKTHLVGGCDLEQALRKALEFAKDAKNPHLVHVGAGVASLGEPKDDVLAKLIPENVRYIGVGVGKKWSRAFMKMAADRTGGYFTQINPDEPVAWRAFDLLATLNTPRLLDVRVVDPEEKVAYLTDAVTLAQGEEICAFARGPVDKFALPTKVLITGRLDGKPFQREVEVGKLDSLPHGAGYLPRTWAKLEIDRLLADGQDKNQVAITELSKAMYVMSPFTSLLVLENDADYKRFNIDRGRKDHWAMYGCPERIAKVYEPDPLQQRWWGHMPQPQDGQKPSIEQVLDTILMRLPPQYIYANGRQLGLPSVTTARQMVLAGYAVPLDESDFEIAEEDAKRSRQLTESEDRWGAKLGLKDLTALDLDLPLGEMANVTRFNLAIQPRFMKRSELGALDAGRGGRSAGRNQGLALSRSTMLGRLSRNLGVENEGLPQLQERLFEDFAEKTWSEARLGDERFIRNFRRRLPLDGIIESLPEEAKAVMDRKSRRGLEPLFLRPHAFFLRNNDRESLDVFGGEGRRLPDWSPAGLDLVVSSLDGITWPPRWREALEDAWLQQLAEQMESRQSANWLVYSRPQNQLDQRFFGDLTMQAPGFGTTWADVQNTVAQEAQQERPAVAGKIDAAARALFAKARQGGWHAVAYPGVGRIPGFQVAANGQGQFSYQRTLPSGLVEQVVCDGQTLWHLYPEIGLGTRRPFSRFHFDELSRWIPWALPRAEDLAWDADLVAVNDTTVALVPHQPPSTKKDAKPDISRQLQFVFAADGSLTETRVVEMPSGKIVVRQTVDAQGTIRLLDGEGKQLGQRKLDRRAAEAPNVQPKLDELLILDMPLRIGTYWDRRLEADAKNETALQADRLGLFAQACFSQDRDALSIFGAHFHAMGDKRLGFYTLLSARQTRFHQLPNTWARGIATYDVVGEHPQSPLARYLAHQQKNMSPQYNADSSFLEDLPGPADGFIARMTSFRNAWNAWRMGHMVSSDPNIREREKRKLIDFIRINDSPLIAFLLQSNLQHLNSHDRADVSKLIYESQKDYVQPLGLGYAFGYDAAYQLYHKGERKEASRIFRDLYMQAVKEGVLPKIDGTFRQVLDDANSGGPNFGEFVRGIVHDFLKKDQPHFALLTALQASYVGNQSLGDELFQHISQHLPKRVDRLILLASLEYVVHNRLDSRADGLRDKLLAEADVAAKPGVWRLSAALAQQRGQTARAIADLEKALDLEYRQMPDVINLDTVRRDYRQMLGRYLEIAKAAQTLQQPAPADLVGRVVRTADRWRSLDSEATEPCHTAAKILKLLGAKEQAWDYLTTPIALKPNEAAPWTALAQELRGDGDLELADHAYVRAFQSEATNPQILWDRAQNLLQLGRVQEARQVWRQIAAGTWQERFQPLVPQARWHLDHN